MWHRWWRPHESSQQGTRQSFAAFRKKTAPGRRPLLVRNGRLKNHARLTGALLPSRNHPNSADNKNRRGYRFCPLFSQRKQNKLCALSCAVVHRAVKDMCPCRFAYRGSDSGGYGVRVAIDINPSMVNESSGLSTCNSVRWGPQVFLSVL
jgi:hypothetical protein